MGIFRFFVCLFLLALNSSIYALDDGTLTYELSEDGLQVTGCLDSCTGVLSIPLEIQGEDVRSVGPYAFEGSGLTSVSIPDSVVLIDGYAFFRQGSLIDLTIGNSVETIGWMAFHSIGVSSVVIPDSVVSIHGRAFKNTTLSSLVIGNSVTQIGHEAFSGSGLSSVIIPNSVTYIEGEAFKGHALNSIIIGNSVTQIDDNAFSHAVGDVFIMRPAQEQLSIYDFPSTVNIYACDGLDEQNNPLSCDIAFPGQVREVLDAPAASLLIDETGHADIPSQYSSIYPDAFGSKPLETVSIPEGMLTIGDRAFRDTELTSLKIPNSVLSIGEKAFENVNLSSVIIGDSVTSIGFNAFSHLQGDLFILKPSAQRFELFDFPSSSTIFECEGLDDSNLPFGCSEAYLDTFRYIVDAPAGRQLVDENNHVVIPEGYTEIGREAFAGINISSVQFPNGLTKIGPYAFEGSGLTSVSIPDSVVLIDGYAFFRQGSLIDLTIGNSVETIGWMAFHSIGVSSVVIPDSVVSIHGRAFKNTTLSSLVIGNSVTQIGHEAFSGSGLSSVIIPNSVTYIEGEAFKGHALNSIIIGNSVTQIDDNAFSHAVGDVFIMRPAQEQLSIYDFPSTVNIYACDGLDEQNNPLNCSPAWHGADNDQDGVGDNDQASSEIITMTGAAYGGDVWVLDINYPISKTITYVAGSIAIGKNILNAANGFAAQINADPDALQILTASAVDSDEGYSAEVHLQMIEGVDGFDASVSVIGNNDRELSVSITNNLNLDETDSDLDGLTYIEESNLGTSPTNDDTDGDGLKDNIDFDPLGEGYFIDRYFSPMELQNLFTLSDRSTTLIDEYLSIEQGGFHNEILYRIPVSNENGSSLDGYFRVEIEMIEQRNFGSSDKDLLAGISDGENVILFTNNDTNNGGAWTGKDLGTSITETSSVGFGYNLEHYSLLFEWIENQAQLTVKEIRNDGEGYIQSSSIGSPGEIDLSKSLDLVLVGNESAENYRLKGINIIYPDSDMDGLTDIEESNLGTLPANDDTDRDTLPDGWEVENGRDPLVADHGISVGTFHSCVFDQVGVMCWGDNSDGQIDSPSIQSPSSLSSSIFHSCAIGEGGVSCWGWNLHGQTDVPPLVNPIMVVTNDLHSCALDDNGVTCWGSYNPGQARVVPDLENPTQITAGRWHDCAIDGGEVVCWGENYFDQINVPNLENPRYITAGHQHTCALDDSGVVCWGSSQYIDVPELEKPISIDAGPSDTCAIDGENIICWGTGNVTLPDNIKLNKPTQISVGENDICVLSQDGYSCWGELNTPEINFDQDNDGFSNQNNIDAFPLDPTEWLDTDLDGVGNNTDPDDDGDGINDSQEILLAMDPLTPNYDIDNDGITNGIDADADNDGVVNEIDVFPFDSSEQLDHDSDGIGNNADADDDNDNVMDVLDIFPLDAFESADADGDGVGDNADFFPNLAEYSLDSDLDQMPDAWERKYGLNPTDASDAAMDQDNDGYTALEEYEAGTIPLKILDIDANGSVDALTDGLIILRYIFSLRGDALVNNALAADAMRTDVADIEAYVDSLMPGL